MVRSQQSPAGHALAQAETGGIAATRRTGGSHRSSAERSVQSAHGPRAAPDPELPRTGVSLEWERWLSSIFIDAPGYGTRSSTLLLADDRGQARMLETTWLDGGRREYLLDWPVVASSA
ncbi:NRDE family protein [Candidatus Competibacter phosphatis]|uniref:NRDE family protein n=1 Tax=Candidatus Competibacter phosphatis TaxID=221280 RepID=UPI002483CB70|nr:NRDE family protein [Candidatus Competibacter phosphatis]